MSAQSNAALSSYSGSSVSSGDPLTAGITVPPTEFKDSVADPFIIDSVSGNGIADLPLSAVMESLQAVEPDFTPAIEELTGINEKLTVLLAVVICLLAWKSMTVMYKFFRLFF